MWWTRAEYDKLKAKVYYAKFYNASGDLVRDYIPAKNRSTNEIGLYDKISKTWFYNAGTGSFVAGPEIVQS